MKKKAIRTFSLILILTMMLCTASFASQNSSAYISSTSAYITKSGNEIKVYFTIVGRGLMTEIGASEIYLYEQNGNTWSLVCTFDAADSDYTSSMLSYNSNAKSSHITYDQGSSSKNYYAIVYFYAANANGSDTIPYYT